MRKVSLPVTLPLSKSVAARLLTLRFLSGQSSEFMALPDCDDTQKLAYAYRLAEESRDCGIVSVVPIGAGAASMRFFLASAASVAGVRCLVDADSQLRRRPVAELLHALKSVGADVSVDADGLIVVNGLHMKGGDVLMHSDVTSQFISALLMASPMWSGGMKLSLTDGVPVSLPYIRMTLDLMARYGADMDVADDFRSYVVRAGRYSMPSVIEVEPDWSAASYFYEAVLIGGGSVVIGSLPSPDESLQGDSACCAIFERLGVTTVFRDDGSAVLSRVDGKHGQLGDEEVFVCDMRSTPDLVPAVAVALCFSSVKFELRGVGHLRYKECDRLEALAEALASFGYVLEIGNDELIWNGLKSRSVPPGCVEINTRSDHRMLMAFAPLVFRGYSIRFDDLECVAKSFPGFATQFARLREDFGKCNAL